MAKDKTWAIQGPEMADQTIEHNARNGTSRKLSPKFKLTEWSPKNEILLEMANSDAAIGNSEHQYQHKESSAVGMNARKCNWQLESPNPDWKAPEQLYTTCQYTQRYISDE